MAGKYCSSLMHPFLNSVDAANSCALFVFDSTLSDLNPVSNLLTKSDISIETASQI